MRRASQVWAIGHKARSTKLQAAVTKRPSSAGNIFTPCMISGPSARKTALDGKIPAPCIQNHPIAPGNGHMGRRCCHFYPKKHAWGENVASKGAYCAHSAKRERIRRDSCQMGPRSAAMQGRGAGFYGAARWVTPLGRATQRTTASAGRTAALAGATGRRRDTGGCRAGKTLAGMAVWGRDAGGIGGDRKLARRRLGASLAALAGTAVRARRWRTRGATGAMEAGDSWPRGVGAHSAQYANAGGCYSPKLASIAATRSSSAPMSCWFTSSIFCKSAGEAFST